MDKLSKTPYETREAWLTAATEALGAEVFAPVGETLPAVRLSVGWPGGRGNKNAVIGQCWSSAAAADKVSQVFVSPVLDDASRVLDVLAHELIHAVDDCTSGHKGRFGKIARAIGLEGKLTATVAGPALKARLDTIAANLGAYPHAALANAVNGAEGPKKQTTRMLKVECAEGSGYKARITRQWLDEYGAPFCPCHGEQMQAA